MLDNHQVSAADKKFYDDFMACRLPLNAFAHVDHIRLAYILLKENDFSEAHKKLKMGLQRFLSHHEVDPTKYHETITHAWLAAVAHFMHIGCPALDSQAFVAANPRLLDRSIMMTHYTKKRLASDAARMAVIEPNLLIIPRHH